MLISEYNKQAAQLVQTERGCLGDFPGRECSDTYTHRRLLTAILLAQPAELKQKNPKISFKFREVSPASGISNSCCVDC